MTEIERLVPVRAARYQALMAVVDAVFQFHSVFQGWDMEPGCGLCQPLRVMERSSMGPGPDEQAYLDRGRDDAEAPADS